MKIAVRYQAECHCICFQCNIQDQIFCYVAKQISCLYVKGYTAKKRIGTDCKENNPMKLQDKGYVLSNPRV